MWKIEKDKATRWIDGPRKRTRALINLEKNSRNKFLCQNNLYYRCLVRKLAEISSGSS